MKTISDIMNLTGERLLAISENAPEKLFSGDLEIARTEYHALSRRWHPDHNGDAQATTVFQHVAGLYRKTQDLIKNGDWRGPGILDLPGRAAGDYLRQLRYFKKVPFELGDMYIGENRIAFAVERVFADLFENAKRQISKLRFADHSMQKEIERYLPRTPEYFETGKRLIMILPKPGDMILLEDLREYMRGAIDARHVAWIGNRLHNLACYFEYAGIVHHDISPQTFFVSPRLHTGMLLGGWWYARFNGEKIRALPARTINLAPADIIRRGQADGRVDLELIRQTGRELLGKAHGGWVKTNEKIPPAMARWFNGVTSGSAVTDYELWSNALETDFGAPRFIRLDAEPEKIYGRYG